MITILFLVIAIICAVLAIVFKVLSPILLILFLVFIFILSYHILHQCKTYGYKKVFGAFKISKQSVEVCDYLELMLRNLKGYGKIIRNQKQIIWIHQSGIYCFLAINEKGKITGDLSSEELIEQQGKKERKISNFLLPYFNHLIMLHTYFKEAIESYLVLDNKCQLKVAIPAETKVYLMEVTYYKLKQRASYHKYSKNEVDQFYQNYQNYITVK